MSRPLLLECPSCGAPTRFQVPFCAYCRAPLTWQEAIPIERGRELRAEVYPAAPLLGEKALSPGRVERTSDGHLVNTPLGGAAWAIADIKARDLCCAVEAVTLDPLTAFGAMARAYSTGGVVDTYVAVVAPGFRSVRLSRLVEGGPISCVAYLRDWECSPFVLPTGQLNALEIRCADSMLQVLVNGQRVISEIDAGLGFGTFGWRALSLEGPGRVLLRSLRAFGVA